MRNYAEVVTEDALSTAKTALEANGFTVKVDNDADAAREAVLDMIPEKSEVFTATSVTLNETGLTKELNESGKYISARDKFAPLAQDPETKLQSRQLGSASEYALGSVHAITEDGQVVMASNTGSQLPNFVYGADHVIWLAGTQKIVKDMNQAMDRLEKHTFPLEDERAKQAYGVNSIMSKVVVFKKDPPHRITIVLIKEAIGY